MFLILISISDDMIIIWQIVLEDNSSNGLQVVHPSHKTFRIAQVIHLSQHDWE